MSQIQERYTPVPMAANTTFTLSAIGNISGFLAVTSGTLTVVDSLGVTVVAAVPVTAGIYTPMPYRLAGGGGLPTVTLAGGASGTLGTY